MNKTQIIKTLTTGALLSYKKYNILPSVTIAQAILETGWMQHVKGNNIFGIKWTTGCGYEFQELNTHEWINGVKTPMVCKFRKYDSLDDSILDHGKLLSLNRYKDVINSKDYKDACQNLYSCGYCTDYEYPQKLISIIEENKLYLYDPVFHGKSPISNNLENIKYLQSCLNLMKIRDANNNGLVVDGSSGPLTISAIKKFQNIVGITADGLCGPETSNAIESIMKKPICSINSSGNKIAIRYLQYRFKATIDGIYGKETLTLVKEYQSSNSLTADGSVGEKTWDRLLS
ncbi:glucosaminidase domain-containing protein [Clostridium sp. CS001]|uniref:glucosaminidase domain-containing protein n=1 Tax=Clostridium sp. CS001 TaxID=2880648 RepID=UPI001CF3476D|nr:glucosaminidase domain-containing protein [Clostridium sp. CS001]MCB2291756.1 glucosaminidase domain-containing protein [Clostridium sp. CS001]